ncbi:MAG: hypothetical protein JO267_15225 [Alphaproteobacteria bacterium]|nr:hypothetical protein [Alphaproteobacteria bacterium]
MQVKEAVEAAKAYVLDLFNAEGITNLGLEEVEYDESAGEWCVTLGFSRPWDSRANALAAVVGQQLNPSRSYKVVRISDRTKEIRSVRNRETVA